MKVYKLNYSHTFGNAWNSTVIHIKSNTEIDNLTPEQQQKIIDLCYPPDVDESPITLDYVKKDKDIYIFYLSQKESEYNDSNTSLIFVKELDISKLTII